MQEPSRPEVKSLPPVKMPDEMMAGQFRIRAKPVFWLSGAAMGLFLLLGAMQMGVPADAPIDYSYGKAGIRYFTSFGADTAFAALQVNGHSFPDQKYYGAAFEMLAPAINVVLNPANPFITHHILCALAGLVLLLFTGLIARQLKGWSAGLLALWLIFLTPAVTGNAFFNSKDIPFAAAFAIGFYFFVQLLQTQAVVRRSTIIGLAAGIFTAVAIRISGILLPAYLGFFAAGWYVFAVGKNERPEMLKKRITPLLVVILLGTGLALLTYPNFWREGISHVTGGLAATKKFQHSISMLYNDKIISSQKIDPVGYLWRYLYMTVPELVMLGFVLSSGIILFCKNRFQKTFTWMLFYAALFPFAWVMLMHSPVYNGWRHVMFAYPFVAVITSMGITELFLLVRGKIAGITLGALLLAALLDLLLWQVRAFPFNYIYYNHLSGGLPGIYKHYDTDYQQLATHNGVKWLLENEPVANRRITILSNNANALQYEYDSAKVKFDYVAIKDMWAVDWDYAVVSTVFLNQKAIDAMFPPYGTIHTVERFGVPLSFVVKRESRDDLTVFRMMRADSLAYAANLIEKVYRSNSTNTTAWYWKACLLYLKDDYAASLKLLKDYNQLFPDQDYIYELTAYNYYAMGNYAEALKFLNVVYKNNPSGTMYNKLIGDCLTALGHPDQAQFYYNKVRRN